MWNAARTDGGAARGPPSGSATVPMGSAPPRADAGVPRSQWPFPPQARRAYPGPRPAASKPFPALLAPNRAALARDAATLVLAKRSPKRDVGGRSDPALARRLSVIGYAQERPGSRCLLCLLRRGPGADLLHRVAWSQEAAISQGYCLAANAGVRHRRRIKGPAMAITPTSAAITQANTATNGVVWFLTAIPT